MKLLLASAKDKQIVFNYIRRHNEPCDPTELIGSDMSLHRLAMALKRLRRQGLIDSIPGKPISGGARKQLYFVKEVK
jgi:hypothetical protein